MHCVGVYHLVDAQCFIYYLLMRRVSIFYYRPSAGCSLDFRHVQFMRQYIYIYISDVEAPGDEEWEHLKSGGKQWQATPKNLPRMQRTRAIPVA